MGTFDFGAGPVPAHRHTNPDGSIGGWVADTAQVYGEAQVFGNARVAGNALVYGDAQISARLTCVSRSDGYQFTLLPCADEVYRLTAGCRYFTLPEAREHWKNTRGGTPLGEETFAILDFFERMIALRTRNS